MSIAAWIIAYVLIGLLLLITLVYVGVLLMKAYAIRKENRQKHQNYGFILGTPSEVSEPASGTDTPPSPKRLEASVKPPTEPPFSGKEKRVTKNDVKEKLLYFLKVIISQNTTFQKFEVAKHTGITTQWGYQLLFWKKKEFVINVLDRPLIRLFHSPLLA